ncbi:lymphotactin-like [Gracilinanus agilis]|uniref:lymphotactin-like n=1 Tax=Gracilinanus agilis TaxID=191870 RepID=UPI001CFC5F27|nr:lymphotactin-like [Gracilinanus agilis]
MNLLLLALFCFCGLTAHTGKGVGSEVMRKNFCAILRSQPIPAKLVKNYTMEEGLTRAVILTTCKGRQFCADPEAKWVKEIISTMDGATKTRRNICQTKSKRSQ